MLQHILPSDITLITEVLPKGECAIAIAIDYSGEVKAELNLEEFSVEKVIDDRVEERRIRRVDVQGSKVLLQLDPSDENANTSVLLEALFEKKKRYTTYRVSQLKKIQAGGKIFEKAEHVAVEHVDAGIVDKFSRKDFYGKDGSVLSYALFSPESPKGNLPLVLFLHGAGSRGDDNIMQITGTQGAVAFAGSDWQKEHPCYVLAPQVNPGADRKQSWISSPTYENLLTLLNETIHNYPIDRNRIYVTGLSMGGMGTWHLIETFPDVFAGAIPVCGIPNTKDLDLFTCFYPVYRPLNIEAAEKVLDIPVWTVHGIDDPLISVENTSEMYEAVKMLGGEKIWYTELPAGTGHEAWQAVYQNKKMLGWLFEQKNNS